MKYRIVVDNGKPYEIMCKNKKELKKELLELKELLGKGDYHYCDIFVYEIEKEITEEIFKELNI